MNKKVIIALTVVAIAGSLGLLHYTSSAPRKDILTIGILQTASHPALDAAREGFVDTLQTQFGDAVQFVVNNAQGCVATAHTIAQSYHAHADIDAIYAIATPAAQAAAAIEKEKPIFIAAVTDPQAAGLIDANNNICGSTDAIDAASVIKLLRTLVPAAQTVALLSTSGQINSQIQVAQLREALRSQGLTSVEIGFVGEADVPTAVTSACLKADVLLLPTDNVLATTMPVVAAIALQHHKPTIASYTEAVNQGALAARGVDYYVSGQQAAQCARQVLLNKKLPAQLPYAKPTAKLFINKTVLDTLHLTIPDTIAEQVHFVERYN